MFLLGHLGIGSKIISPLSRGLPQRAIWIGTLLPDLIDKSLYYGLSFVTGKKGIELGLISGSRTLTHTSLFLLGLSSISLARKSKLFAALSLGVASHLILDSWTSLMRSPQDQEIFQSVLVWPLAGWSFPVIPFQNLSEHLGAIQRPLLFWSEAAGALLLLSSYLAEKEQATLTGSPQSGKRSKAALSKGE